MTETINDKEITEADDGLVVVDGIQPVSEISRFYALAKRAEWRIEDLDWNKPPTPASEKPNPRRVDLYRSVLSQQLQADELACLMAAQLLNAAPHAEARLYYSTMVQDESRHTEAWLKLLNTLGDRTDLDPHLSELVRIVLEADTIEEKIFLMQVFFEKAIIHRFDQIARSAGGTVLEELCNKLKVDDGIHHGSGMALERELLAGASKAVKLKVFKTANAALPHFTAHVLWRPPERAFLRSHMEKEDRMYVRTEVEQGIKRAHQLGLDFSEAIVPFQVG